ncbi:GGDEF domain-containing protein [Shewanella sp. NIFS-20-20]|uniref:GGDEF domain-containing protein n=1 Tax=Shewanella sp. NIFS-20-20 TaxID=2853806 RepID=UPI001C437C31|nr:GGDEF domain-containing protein [Shewanella sp. NIFS-20-20]MBV7315033.1 diguanylate cyclase [Shewanella sp. NIFS-20-20]
MKIVQQLRLLIIFSIGLTGLLLAALLKQVHTEQHASHQMEQILALGNQVDTLANNLWALTNFNNPDEISFNLAGLSQLEVSLHKIPRDDVIVRNDLAILGRDIAQIRNLLSLSQQQKELGKLGQQGELMLQSNLNMAIQSLRESIYHYKRHVIGQHRQYQLQLVYLNGGILLLFTLLISTISILILKRFDVGIRSLTLGVKQVACGELSKTVSSQYQDELGFLTNHFNQMRKNLQQTTMLKGELEVVIRRKTQALQEQAEQLQYLAEHDDLCGLLSRNAFEQSLNIALERCHRDDKKGAVVFIDLNEFKPINDTHGHQFGDLVLQQLSTRLSLNLRKSDLIGRFGGDEFVLWLENKDTPGALPAQLTKLVTLIEDTMEFNGIQVQLGASLGVSRYPDDGTHLFELLQKADSAMYRAKKNRAGQLSAVAFAKEVSPEDNVFSFPQSKRST